MTQLLAVLNGTEPPHGFLQNTAIVILKAAGQLYGLIQGLRAQAYAVGIFSSYTPPCPVISVGNITAGGTGKTPMVIWLARYFHKQGKKVAVVSRGYRQLSKLPVTVVADPAQTLQKAPFAADEAVLIAEKLPGVTVLTGPKRRQTIAYAVAEYGCDLVIMDDAFQHMQVARSLDLALVDCTRPFGNGGILPGGILREAPSALRRAHGIVITRADDQEQLATTRQELARKAPQVPSCHAVHQACGWIRLTDKGLRHAPGLPIAELAETPVLAFCGIANPANFAKTLTRLGLSIKVLVPFADHHQFQEQTMDGLMAQARSIGAKALVCTEKDLVKIEKNSYDLPIYALAMELHFPNLSRWLQDKLDDISTAGNKTES